MGTLVANNIHGFGNRLGNIVASKIFSNEIGWDLKIFWVKNSSFNCDYNKIFKNNLHLTQSILTDEVVYRNHTPYIFESWKLKYDKTKNYYYIKPIHPYTHYSLSFLFRQSYQLSTEENLIKNKLVEMFSAIEFQDYLYDKAFKFIKNNLPDDYSSILVRTGINDIVERTNYPDNTLKNKQGKIKLYLDQIEKHKNIPFYLTGDNPNIIKELGKKYPNMTTRDDRNSCYGERVTTESVIDDVIDFIVCSNGKGLLGDFEESTFIQTCYLFGHAKHKIMSLPRKRSK